MVKHLHLPPGQNLTNGVNRLGPKGSQVGDPDPDLENDVGEDGQVAGECRQVLVGLHDPVQNVEVLDEVPAELGVACGVGRQARAGLGLGSPSWDLLGPNRFTPLVRFWPGEVRLFNNPPP